MQIFYNLSNLLMVFHVSHLSSGYNSSLQNSVENISIISE